MSALRLGHIAQAAEKQWATFADLPKVDVPYTTITNRAQCTDFSNDLMPRMGIERVMIQRIQVVQDEYGPNGELVFKPINDLHNQVRFVGKSFVGTGRVSESDSNGTRVQANTIPGSYVEITFYGTGLNLLTYDDASDRSFTVATDGGAPGAAINTGGDTKLTLWFSEDPGSAIQIMCQQYWDALDELSTEATNYVSQAQIKSTVDSLKAGLINKTWNQMSVAERKLVLNQTPTRAELGL